MATERPLKSILKKPAAVPAYNSGGDDNDDDDENVAAAVFGTSSRLGAGRRQQRSAKDNAEIARKHALVIQQRKDLEVTIFAAIERLTEFPLVRGPTYSAARPAASDAAAFAQLVRIFQPGDYDDLVEERNTCGLCGYSLCANPRQTFAAGGAWKLVPAAGGLVRKSELEKWCSRACARRALYVKVQLNETAAWERVGIPDIQVELLPEEAENKDNTAAVTAAAVAAATDKSTTTAASSGPPEQLARDMTRLKISEERKQLQNAQTLALERGEASASGGIGAGAAVEDGQPTRILPPTDSTLVDVRIVEKTVTTAPAVPKLDSGIGKDQNTVSGSDTHMWIEGYRSKYESTMR
ncbi:hypothetical protein SPI_07402 [Niveomyces insectorum RCEF 264]|uniref:RNA polymerase II subunit B1 CTD phosphatase RPAP2 homolog n=1 Tax=Niveomyces insectorum RCEF 264 TaxID=1081102 RepID=A0A167PTW3_9HYPO|nr:hypothetical protein SPI_07402 [Niveomyces insectorum RCEF 264]